MRLLTEAAAAVRAAKDEKPVGRQGPHRSVVVPRGGRWAAGAHRRPGVGLQRQRFVEKKIAQKTKCFEDFSILQVQKKKATFQICNLGE